MNFKLNHLPFMFLLFSILLWTNCDKDDDNKITLTDVDGNTYDAVEIGSQIWMSENLRVTHYRNGDEVPRRDRLHWDASGSEGAYCNYDDQEDSFADTYGRLYNWAAVADQRKLAPEGWHIPSEAEWLELGNFLQGDSIAGGKLKETGTGHWHSPNTGATDEVDFRALPAGERVTSLTEDDGLGLYGAFWTSTPSDVFPTSALFRVLGYDTAELGGRNDSANKSGGFSVRCVKDQ